MGTVLRWDRYHDSDVDLWRIQLCKDGGWAQVVVKTRSLCWFVAKYWWGPSVETVCTWWITRWTESKARRKRERERNDPDIKWKMWEVEDNSMIIVIGHYEVCPRNRGCAKRKKVWEKSTRRCYMKVTIFCAHYTLLKMSSGNCSFRLSSLILEHILGVDFWFSNRMSRYVLYFSHSIYCPESVIKSCISWHVVSRILSFMSCFPYVALSFMNSLCFSWPLCVIKMILSFVHLLEPAVYLSAHINGPVLPNESLSRSSFQSWLNSTHNDNGEDQHWAPIP